jgi:hypothetical protein
MRRTLVYFFIVTSTLLCSQQIPENRFYNEFNFIIHLANNKLFAEAESEKQKLFSKEDLPEAYHDSVNFFIGMAYYKEKKFSEARQSFLNVSDETFLFYKAHYLAGNIDAENNAPDSALKNYHSIPENTNEALNELKSFEIAGLYLLKSDYAKFDSISGSDTYRDPVIRQEFENLKTYSERGRRIRRKSPLLAGTLSAIVPGLGKVYAGNNGQALASFLTCGLMAVVAGENYYHLGITHPQTIFFTGLLGFFYVGNIWGSALSVQLVKIEQQLENKHNILVGLKVPIHQFFN